VVEITDTAAKNNITALSFFEKTRTATLNDTG
jgi:hypothetical protein